MKDWSGEAALLKIQYKALKPKEAEIRDEEREEARRRAEAKIRSLRSALAEEIKRHFEAGMPQSVFQDEVIGTRDWNAMKRWKDLMNIPSAAEIRAAKKAENAIFLWNEAGDLVVKRASDGTPVEPVTFLWSTVRESNGRYIIDAADFADESRILRNDVPLRKIVEDAVRARVAEVGLDNRAEKP